LSYLPRLWGVIRGDLRLFGVSPLSPGEAQSRSEDWQRVRDQAPVGLLGPTQLLLSADDALDERLMSDAFYVGQRGWRRHLQLLGDALRLFVSPRAWRMGTPS
jgi:lipopolysaccharide/colanic/teichoic acid biosynthesis glycosyltransferase